LNGSLIAFRADPFPSNNELNQLWRSAWDADKESDFSAILARSLAHVGAFDEDRLVGFVNVAWDGGIHAFLLDTCVAPEMRRQGIATKLIKTAIEISRARVRNGSTSISSRISHRFIGRAASSRQRLG
jgi:ribosomal protein S18 acetylase RimI-like enzyme